MFVYERNWENPKHLWLPGRETISFEQRDDVHVVHTAYCTYSIPRAVGWRHVLHTVRTAYRVQSAGDMYRMASCRRPTARRKKHLIMKKYMIQNSEL